MSTVFEAGVLIHLTDRVSAGLGQIAKQFTKTETAAAALQNKLNKISSTFQSGLVLVGAGSALAAPLIVAVNEASKLEKAMKNVQVVTRASQDQMRAYDPLMSSISHKTAVFSKTMLADFALHMARGGIRDSVGIQKLLPSWADAADILKITKETSPNQTAEALTSISHQFGNFQPNAAMAQTVKDFVTLMQTSPGSLAQFVKGGAYINPTASRLFQMDERSLFALQATMGQTSGGSGGRGGLSPSQQMNMISRSLPGIFGSGLFEGKSAFALRVMGLSDKDGLSTLKTGNKFDIMKMSAKLEAFEKLGLTASGRMQIAQVMRDNAPMMGKQEGAMREFANNVLKKHGDVMGSELTMKAFQFAFGAGSKAAAMLGDSAFRQQMQFNINKMATAPSLDVQQKQLSGTFSFAKIQAQTDFGSLLADIGKRILPHATQVVKAVDAIIFKMDNFVNKHPRVVDALWQLTAAMSGLLIAAGIGNIISSAAQGLKVLFGIFGGNAILKLLAPVGTAIGTALAGLTAEFWVPVLALVAVVALIVAAVMNWKTIMKAVQPVIDAVASAFRKLVMALSWVVGKIGGLIALMPGLDGLGLSMMKAANGVASATRAAEAASKVHNYPGAAQIPKNTTFPGAVAWKPAAGPVTNNTTNNFHIHGAGDPEKVAAAVTRKLAKDAGHAASASSGNSVSRSINHGGATRP